MGYYEGKIRVVGTDRMCFPVDAKTLAPLACSTYDAHAFSDPDPEPVETISVGQWLNRRTPEQPE